MASRNAEGCEDSSEMYLPNAIHLHSYYCVNLFI